MDANTAIDTQNPSTTELFKKTPVVQLVRGGPHPDWTPKLLALFITGSYIFIQYHLITSVVDPSMREMVMRSLGTLDTLVGFVFAFYYGTSLSSQRKQETLDAVTKESKG